MSIKLSGLNPLAYIGVEPITPPLFVVYDRAPTSTDTKNVNLGTLWLVKASQDVYILVSLSGGVADWVLFTGGSGSVTALEADDSNQAVPTAGVITVAGGSNINTTAVGSTLTVNLDNSISVSGSVTAGTGITSTTGNIVATAGQVNAGTTVTGGTGLIATTGDVTVMAGNVTLPDTNTTATEGVITFSSDRYIHNYGTDNIFCGRFAGNTSLTLASSVNNSGFGRDALMALTIGSANTALGAYALDACTQGSNNTACGFRALGGVTTGGQNTAIGQDAHSALSTGARNVAIGNDAGQLIQTGTDNVLIGYQAGISYNGAESNNIIIGREGGSVGESNVISIGQHSGGTLSTKCLIGGIRGVTTDVNDAIAVLIDSAGQLGTTSSSIRFKENVVDMDASSDPVMGLRPVTFNYKADSSKTRAYGLIAEEVAQVFPALVARGKNGLPESVKYHELPTLLLNELQKQRRRIGQLEQKLASLMSGKVD